MMMKSQGMSANESIFVGEGQELKHPDRVGAGAGRREHGRTWAYEFGAECQRERLLRAGERKILRKVGRGRRLEGKSKPPYAKPAYGASNA